MPSARAPALATGERPVTGEPRYDKFFAEINGLLVAVQEARREEAEVRAAAARRVGLPETVAIDVLGARLRERTARLAVEGLTLELEFTGIDAADEEAIAPAAGAESAAAEVAADPDPDGAVSTAPPPTATLRTPGREPERRELRLLEVLAQAALSGATIYAEMDHVRRRTDQLVEQAAELRGSVDAAFKDASQRAHVRSKFAEAEELLPQLKEQAKAIWNAADVLIAILDEAANTAPAAPPNRRRAPREVKDVPIRDGAQQGSPANLDRARQAAPRRPDAAPGAATPPQDRAPTDFQP